METSNRMQKTIILLLLAVNLGGVRRVSVVRACISRTPYQRQIDVPSSEVLLQLSELVCADSQLLQDAME
jgi:hypothetical protein